MYNLARNLLFRFDPETSHEIALDLMGAAERLGVLSLLASKIPQNPKEVMGLQFPNPVGLAAGLDKNGDYFNALGKFGFGFIEIGTVTPLPQAGNPSPRLFRLPDHEAIINRMGFNNKGVQHLANRVRRRRYKGVLGINIGKNKVTPEANALSDYEKCMDIVYPLADYITINISSPNTPGLRNLQFGKALENLLEGLKERQHKLRRRFQKYVPLAVKIAPDMNSDELAAVASCFLKMEMDGVIATNTTVSRDEVEGAKYADEAGGLSGKPLMETSTQVVSQLSSLLRNKIPIIAVGGISSGDDALSKIEAGADLVQLYTGFIYRGPGLVKEAADAIASAHTR